ncbi:MAG: aspartate aminotransferase family protein [Thermomicrobiales bacterium]|nr:aspartate aminotransferase family protein [Thermomicrobiales bacterium]
MAVVEKPSDLRHLAGLDVQHVIHPLTNLHAHQAQGPIIWDRGEGIDLYDNTGKEYIDAAAGMWNVNVGHGRTELAEVAASQMRRLEYASSFGGASNQPSIELAERVAQLTPGDLNTLFFTAGGSESNDSAFKLARLYWKQRGAPQKRTIIARYMGYHGLTLATTQATGIPRYWEMIEPGVSGFVHVSPPYAYRHGGGLSEDEFVAKLADELEETIIGLGADTVAAFIAEPIMGTGGVIVPPDDYFERIREICDRYDVLMIADEVITGFGRTGTWFAMEHWNTVPDIMTIAKGISSGYVPLGGVILTERVREALYGDPALTFMHGFTYTGHPVACAVGVRNLDIIEREGLVEQAARVGAYLISKLKEVGERHDCVGEVRGRGMMAGMEFVLDRDTRAEAAQSDRLSGKVSRTAFRMGLICRPMPGSDVLAFSPPLIANESDVDRIAEILDEAIAEVASSAE